MNWLSNVYLIQYGQYSPRFEYFAVNKLAKQEKLKILDILCSEPCDNKCIFCYYYHQY